jgi:hypothetical protein
LNGLLNEGPLGVAALATALFLVIIVHGFSRPPLSFPHSLFSATSFLVKQPTLLLCFDKVD